jgi:hypothetical protein
MEDQPVRPGAQPSPWAVTLLRVSLGVAIGASLLLLSSCLFA